MSIWIWIGVVIGAIVLLVLIAAVVGSRLPEGHRASRTLTLSVPRSELWARITDFSAQVEWNKRLSKTERLPDRDGCETWQDTYGRNKLILIVRESTPQQRLVREVEDPAGYFSGDWTFELADSDGGSTLTITENGAVHSAIARAFMKLFWNNAAYVERYLRSLAESFGQEPAIIKMQL